jgi:peptidoglycan hydrolase CwlO-like protein
MQVLRGGTIMRRAVAGVLCGTLMLSANVAQAGGMGRLLGALVTRGAISAGAHAAAGAAHSKTYTSDFLTVTQLVACLKRANGLDQDGNQLDTRKAELDGLAKQIKTLEGRIETKRNTIDRSSQIQVDSVNADIETLNATVDRIRARGAEHNQLVRTITEKENAYNDECAKKYYSEDMTEARRLAGL